MAKGFIAGARKALNHLGLDVVCYPQATFPPDFDQEIRGTILSVQPYTQTSPERINALCEAVKYIVAHEIPGDIVECGVWRGGSMMAVARTLLRLGERGRNLYLFDTFEGMPPPGSSDVALDGTPASALLDQSDREDEESVWCYAPLDQVREALSRVGYPQEKTHFVKGRVEDTIPAGAPEAIALLRLDTDWYESTRHELIHLFPRLSPGAILIIDDYGHWEGARRAVDEYLEANRVKILLNRIDYTGRIGVVGNG